MIVWSLAWSAMCGVIRTPAPAAPHNALTGVLITGSAGLVDAWPRGSRLAAGISTRDVALRMGECLPSTLPHTKVNVIREGARCAGVGGIDQGS